MEETVESEDGGVAGTESVRNLHIESVLGGNSRGCIFRRAI